MNYCTNCGAGLTQKIPEGDNMPRFICDECGLVHYQNPKIVAACIPEWQGKILLCKRAIAPRVGLWTIPAGFMENGESVNQAAVRETFEEAQAEVEIIDLFGVYNIVRVNQVYVIFRGRMITGEFSPGMESLETDLFTKDQIPWDSLAFRVIHKSLVRYYADLEREIDRPFIDDVP